MNSLMEDMSGIYMEDVESAKVLSFSDKMLASLTSTLSSSLGKVMAAGITQAINKATIHAVYSVLKAYQKLHPNVNPMAKFTTKSYDLLETMDEFKVKFRLAHKWGEKIDTRVEVKVFFYEDKARFGVAYGKLSHAEKYNTEMVWMDKTYKKEADYYTAGAHAKIGIGHPSIPRMIDALRKDARALKENEKEVIEEAVESYYEEGTYDDHYYGIMNACAVGYVTKEEALGYMKAMELAGFDTESDNKFDW